MAREKIEFRLQPKQEDFASCKADICFFGGAAGGGKSRAALTEPVRHIKVKGFNATIFRRTMADVKKPGSIWDESCLMYPYLRGKSNISDRFWQFPSGVRVQFSGMALEGDKYDWQGSQLCLIIFEEVTHFTATQFWYMLTRNRSTCGVKPYVRATCNPDADSWVRELIDWWIGDDGYVIPERSGVLRYFTRINNNMIWADSPEEIRAMLPDVHLDDWDIKSFTFIASKITDNPALLKVDPGYVGNLKAQDQVTRKRLLDGNWDIRETAGMYFQKKWFIEIEERELPDDIDWVRSWDFAATEKGEAADPDWTAGVLMGKSRSTKAFYVADCEAFLGSPLTVRLAVERVAKHDTRKWGKDVRITVPKDPAAAGKAQAHDWIQRMAGYRIKWLPTRKGKKVKYAQGFSAQVEGRNVYIVRAPWNAEYYKELENFPEVTHDDRTDASSDAFNELSPQRREMQIGS
jgi:predicted phage terminase large subunit-like protein